MIKASSKGSSKDQNLQMDYGELKKAALVLRAINHEVRQKILNLIHKNKEITVSEIYAKLKIEQSLTSSHLAVLRKAGVVNTRREGQSIHYSINYAQISLIGKGAKIISG